VRAYIFLLSMCVRTFSYQPCACVHFLTNHVRAYNFLPRYTLGQLRLHFLCRCCIDHGLHVSTAQVFITVAPLCCCCSLFTPWGDASMPAHICMNTLHACPYTCTFKRTRYTHVHTLEHLNEHITRMSIHLYIYTAKPYEQAFD
jgi:hypothetical protein